ADGKKRDNFGHSVDIFGEHLIVSAYLDDSKAGSAYIFIRNGDRWRQQAKLTGNDTAKGDNFGEAVAFAGNENGVDFAIVGAPNNTHNGKKSGAAYIFVHDGGKWTEEAKLVSADAQTSDFIGDAVSISGHRGIKRYALVGAPHLDLAQDVEGRGSAAYIFSSDGGAWTEEAKLTAKDKEKADGFGSGVSINRNIALVGVPRHGEGAILDGELNAGIVYPYLREGDQWIRQGSRATTIPPEFPEQSFGNVVIATQEFIVIAAYGLQKGNPDRGDPNGGAVYIYYTQRDWKLPYSVEPSLLRAATLGGIKRTALFQNFPNPFNPETWLPYQLGRKSDVAFHIYNTRGQLVRRLDVGLQPVGSYQDKDTAAYWDGQDQLGQPVSSGLYFYTLTAGTSQITRRMLILK
ncbi:MAG: T9SS type A sorting domain-containing protein, partial [Candidatus Poribacteria bacterium]|nr:T9SS type A sorting domain-containing protein [Candidatus Poribacteria bacterium]